MITPATLVAGKDMSDLYRDSNRAEESRWGRQPYITRIEQRTDPSRALEGERLASVAADNAWHSCSVRINDKESRAPSVQHVVM